LVFFCKVFYYLVPNFQTMNVRDIPPGFTIPLALGRGRIRLAYTGVCLALTALLFRKKEF